MFYDCHLHEKSNYGYISSWGWTFCEFRLIFDYLRVEIGGAGYRSVDRESCGYELTMVVGGLYVWPFKGIIGDLYGFSGGLPRFLKTN